MPHCQAFRTSTRTPFGASQLLDQGTAVHLVLILTIAGVAYTSFSKNPIVGYWEILAPIIALVCVGYGWQDATDKTARLRLIVTRRCTGSRSSWS